MTLQIEEEVTANFSFDAKELANQVISYTIEREDFPYEAEINLTFVDETAIQRLNREYRNIDKSTDVLSFPMLEYEQAGDFSQLEDDRNDNFNPDSGEILLGDMILCIPKVFSQAEEYGHSVEREFAFLIVHSMLHLFGYDHMKPEEAAIMEKKQRMILEELNFLR